MQTNHAWIVPERVNTPLFGVLFRSSRGGMTSLLRHSARTVATMPRTAQYLTCLLGAVAGLFLNPSCAQSATITLTASDEYGTSSFNSAGHWSNGAAPTSGNAYVITDRLLRTPAYTTSSFTFGGDSLTLNGGAVLAFKYSTTFTINNLTLDNATVANWFPSSALYSPQLVGSITLGSGGVNFSTNLAQHDFVVRAPMSGSGGIRTVDGPGVVTLSAANTYTGDTKISSAQLRLNNANAAQNSTVVVDMENGVVFGNGIGSFNLGGLAGSGTAALADTAGSRITLNIGGNGQTTTFTGMLTGSGGVNKKGAGTTVFSGANSFSGDTTVGGGTLIAGNDGALGDTAAGTTVQIGGTLARISHRGEWPVVLTPGWRRCEAHPRRTLLDRTRFRSPRPRIGT